MQRGRAGTTPPGRIARKNVRQVTGTLAADFFCEGLHPALRLGQAWTDRVSLAVLTPWTGYRAVSRVLPWDIPRVFPWVVKVQVVDDQRMSATVFGQPRNSVCLNQRQFRALPQTKESSCQVEMLRIQFDTDGVPDREEVVTLMNRGATTDAQD